MLDIFKIETSSEGYSRKYSKAIIMIYRHASTHLGEILGSEMIPAASPSTLLFQHVYQTVQNKK